jgi:phasin family protein
MTTKAKITEAATTINEAAAQAASKGLEQTVASLKDGMAQATAGFETTQAKVKEGVEKAMKTTEEMVAFGQGNLDAFMKSSQIWAAGMQDLSKQVAATAQASFDETVSVFKAMSTVKSPKDALEMQADLGRKSLEKAVAETGRLTDASLKLAEQAMAPIAARVSLASEKFAKAV